MDSLVHIHIRLGLLPWVQANPYEWLGQLGNSNYINTINRMVCHTAVAYT